MSDIGSLAAKALSASQGVGTNVQVAVRCRPSNCEEKKLNQPTVITCDSENKTLKVSFGPAGKKISKNYTFDKVFGMYSTQEEVFESVVRPIVDEALAGFNCTIFAYGQTGTGKTHTMEGNIHSEEHAGIVPRSVKAILEQLEASDSEYTIRVSFLELYNEELQDLLNTSGDRKLKLCEDIKKGVVCQNLEEITVLNAGDIFEILQKGILQRQTAETLMNKNSSRSHSIFTMKIMIKECNVDGEEVVRHGQLNLVDLAGSECIGRSGAKNDRAREAGSINQSLLTLGRVITALVDHHGHIPYRDSKLTRLLQESLGGKAKTVIIATLSPSQLAVEETMSTLDYAHRAKNIKNQPTVNQRMTKKVVLKEYCAEIETLKSQLQLTREKNGVYVNPEEYYAMEARIQTQESQIIECEAALKCRNEEIKGIRLERDDLIERNEENERLLQHAKDSIEDLKESLTITKTELAITRADWLAAEEVIKEQSCTESTLHIQGGTFKDEVQGRREDVKNLLDKVSRFSDEEAKRVKNAAVLINGIAHSTTQLQDGISKISEESKVQSTHLCTGVSEMLSRGRETCSALKISIDGALSTLIGDASEARDSMTSSCDQLQGHLGETNGHVEKTLKTLQENLSKWLGEVDESMKSAQQLLSDQNTHLDSFSTALLMQTIECTDMNNQFAKELDIDFKTASEKSLALGEELKGMFLSYTENVLRDTKSAKEQMELKAAAIEEAVKGMLLDLVSSTNNSILATATAATTFSKKASKLAKTGLTSLDKASSLSHGMVIKHTTQQNGIIETNKVNQLAQLSTVRHLGTSTDSLLNSISGDVGTKRSTLDMTVSSLLGDVDSALKKARVSVQDTSNTANVILKKVVTATKSMTSSSNKALDSFESFINKEGENVQENLGNHFRVLDSHFIAQNTEIESVNSMSDEYGMEARETLGATGRTPGKSLFRPLEDLVKTRNHDSIRADFKKSNEQTMNDENSRTEEGSQRTLDLQDSTISTAIATNDANSRPQGFGGKSCHLTVSVPIEGEVEDDAPMSVCTVASMDSERSDGSKNSYGENENSHPNKQEEKKSGLSKISKLGRPNSNRSIKAIN